MKRRTLFAALLASAGLALGSVWTVAPRAEAAANRCECIACDCPECHGEICTCDFCACGACGCLRPEGEAQSDA